MSECRQSAVPPAVSPRQHPLWKRLERQSKLQSGLTLFFLSAVLALPAASDLDERISGTTENDRPVAAETLSPAPVPSGSPEKSSEENTVRTGVREHLEMLLRASAIAVTGVAAMLYSGGVIWRRDQMKRQGFTKEQIENDRYELLPEDHPLRVGVEEYGRMMGIKVSQVYLDSVPQYRNAAASVDSEGSAVIWFRGNPLLQREGGTLLKGVTAHELAHVKRNSFADIYLLRAVGTLYGGLAAASGAMVMGGIRENFFSVVLKASLAALACLPALSRWSSRTDEALTDLEGAAMTGDPESVIANKTYLQSHKPGGGDWSPSEIDMMNLRSVVMLVFGSTHPSDKERIANLQEVFDIHNKNQRAPIPVLAPDRRMQEFQA